MNTEFHLSMGEHRSLTEVFVTALLYLVSPHMKYIFLEQIMRVLEVVTQS